MASLAEQIRVSFEKIQQDIRDAHLMTKCLTRFLPFCAALVDADSSL